MIHDQSTFTFIYLLVNLIFLSIYIYELFTKTDSGYVNKSRTPFIIIFWLNALLVSIFLGLRNNSIGTDTPVYVGFYEHIFERDIFASDPFFMV